MKYLGADKDLEKGGRDLQTVGMSFEQLAVDHRRRKGTCICESRHGKECSKLTTTRTIGVARGYVSGESRRKRTRKINENNNARQKLTASSFLVLGGQRGLQQLGQLGLQVGILHPRLVTHEDDDEGDEFVERRLHVGEGGPVEAMREENKLDDVVDE